MSRSQLRSAVIAVGLLTGTSLSGVAQGSAAPSRPAVVVSAAGFVHPGVFLDRAQLDEIGANVGSGREPWAGAVDRMLSGGTSISTSARPQRYRYSSLDYAPSPVPVLQDSSSGFEAYAQAHGWTDLGAVEHSDDARAAYTHALLFAATGDQRYADKSIEIMNAWSSTLREIAFDEPLRDDNGLPVFNNGKLQAGWGGSLFARAAEIIRYSDAGWANDDVARFATMLHEIYLPLVRTGWSNGANWLMTFAETTIAIGVFTDDRTAFDDGIAMWREKTPTTIYMPTDGPQPIAPAPSFADPGRMRALWYNPTEYLPGLQGETLRDLAHMTMGLGSMANAAETARIQGVDLYGEQAPRIVTGFELNAGFVNAYLDEFARLGREPGSSWVPPDWPAGPGSFTTLNPYYRSGWLVAWRHFVGGGVDMPETTRLVTRLGLEPTQAAIHLSWETLTHPPVAPAAAAPQPGTTSPATTAPPSTTAPTTTFAPTSAAASTSPPTTGSTPPDPTATTVVPSVPSTGTTMPPLVTDPAGTAPAPGASHPPSAPTTTPTSTITAQPPATDPSTTQPGQSGQSGQQPGQPQPPEPEPTKLDMVVDNLTATPLVEAVEISFEAPDDQPLPDVYELTVTPNDGSAPVIIDADSGPLSHTVTGLEPGTVYTFEVTPDPLPPGAGMAAIVTAAPFAEGVINQEISVERPVGAIVLTQRCGVRPALGTFTSVTGFPGFPRSLGAEAASGDEVGTAPIDDTNAPAIDPEFAEYPYPSTPLYPTTCGVELGSAQLVTTGPLAGAYYTAEGALNEITIADTRDADMGWSLNGTVESFTSTADAFESFDGNHLGWVPVVEGDSGPNAEGYDQLVVAGPMVLPGTGVDTAERGLADGRTLASATAGSGLGVASMGGRLILLIPMWVDAGQYRATLTFTAIDSSP